MNTCEISGKSVQKWLADLTFKSSLSKPCQFPENATNGWRCHSNVTTRSNCLAGHAIYQSHYLKLSFYAYIYKSLSLVFLHSAFLLTLINFIITHIFLFNLVNCHHHFLKLEKFPPTSINCVL